MIQSSKLSVCLRPDPEPRSPWSPPGPPPLLPVSHCEFPHFGRFELEWNWSNVAADWQSCCRLAPSCGDTRVLHSVRQQSCCGSGEQAPPIQSVTCPVEYSRPDQPAMIDAKPLIDTAFIFRVLLLWQVTTNTDWFQLFVFLSWNLCLFHLNLSGKSSHRCKGAFCVFSCSCWCVSVSAVLCPWYRRCGAEFTLIIRTFSLQRAGRKSAGVACKVKAPENVKKKKLVSWNLNWRGNICTPQNPTLVLLWVIFCMKRAKQIKKVEVVEFDVLVLMSKRGCHYFVRDSVALLSSF